MTSRFKLTAALLALAAAAVLLVGFFTGLFDASAGGNPDDVDVGTAPDDPGGETLLDADGQPVLEPNPNGPRASGSTGIIGARTPHGLDLSDPEQRQKYMLELINAYEVDWSEFVRVLRVETETLPEEIRAFLLEELTTGRKLRVMEAFSVLQDPTMVAALIDVLDRPGVRAKIQRLVLQALSTMPGADDTEVVLALESRLTDDPSADRSLLRAIGARGGAEGARALVEYLKRSTDPSSIAQSVLQSLDVKNDPEAAKIVMETLADEGLHPDARKRLMLLVGRPGNVAFTETVIALDAEGQSQDMRERALETLARIGGKDALRHLLDKASEPGLLGEKALSLIGKVSSSDVEGRTLLIDALDNVAAASRPVETTEQLLSVLANLREAAAAPKFVEYMRHPTASVQHQAIRGLARLGSLSEPHVPALVDLYAVSDERTKVRIAVALGSIGGQEAVKAMEQMVTVEGIPADLNRTLRMGLLDAKKNLGAAGRKPGAAEGGPGLGNGPR